MGIHQLTLKATPEAGDEVAIYNSSNTHTDRATLTSILSSVASATKIVGFTRNTASGNGSQAVTGVGFRPTAIFFMGSIQSVSNGCWGMSDQSSQVFLAGQDDGGTFPGIYNTAGGGVLLFDKSGSALGTDRYTASVNSYDADGFTLTWTSTGSPVGTVGAFALCWK